MLRLPKSGVLYVPSCAESQLAEERIMDALGVTSLGETSTIHTFGDLYIIYDKMFYNVLRINQGLIKARDFAKESRLPLYILPNLGIRVRDTIINDIIRATVPNAKVLE